MILKRYLFLLAFVLASFSVLCQQKIITGIVMDSHSEERIPFASAIFKNTSTGDLTDSAGTFVIVTSRWPSDTLVVTCVGYQPYKLFIDPAKDTILAHILMERGTFNEGVTVKVKINKGLFLWRKIVDHKDRNDHFNVDNFSYELYNKMEVDLKNIKFNKLANFKPLKPVGNLIRNNIDSAEGTKYLPVYLTEVLSDFYWQKSPRVRREVIKAANTNGLKNESVIKLLGGMDQNVDVYRNFIPVFDKQFASPISDNGPAYYNYRVVDTQFINSRRYYHLVFTPKHRGENSFEGDCWVHDSTYAIQKMNLRLGEDANVNFLKTLSLIQEFRLINDSTWFLAKDKFVADVIPLGKNSPGFIGRKTTTYDHVVVDDSSVLNELAKNKILEEVITLEDANKKDRAFWEENRHEELNRNERAVIQMIDTLRKDPAFLRFSKNLYFLGTGYKKIGNYEIGPWFNWVTANYWEGLRTRFDLGTNEHFHKDLYLHGYLAYGFKDQKFKGKAEAFYLLHRHPRVFLYGSYTNDLDFGQNYYGEVSTDNIFALAIRKNNIPIKFISIKEKRLEFFKETKGGFSVFLSGVHKDFTPLRNLPLKESFPVNGGKDNPFVTFEASVRFRFAYLEKFLEGHYYRFSLGSPYPIPEVYFTKGIAGVFGSRYNYSKISGNVSDFMKIPPFGTLSYTLYAGKTFGTLPYMMLDVHPGNELYYYNKYAFNLMNKYEFISDQYAGINIEHNIGNGIFRLFPKLKFRQFWTAKVLVGSLSDANKALNFVPDHNFQALDGKPYVELGTGVDNILHLFRVDFIWRLSPTPLPSEISRRFGIFGSFRLSF